MISLFSLFFKSFKNILQILIKFDDSETHEILNKKVLLHSICDTRSYLYITIYTFHNRGYTKLCTGYNIGDCVQGYTKLYQYITA